MCSCELLYYIYIHYRSKMKILLYTQSVNMDSTIVMIHGDYNSMIISLSALIFQYLLISLSNGQQPSELEHL